MRFRKPGFIVAVFGVLFFAGFVNAQVVIFSEDFEGTGGLLNGTAEDISGAIFAAQITLQPPTESWMSQEPTRKARRHWKLIWSLKLSTPSNWT